MTANYKELIIFLKSLPPDIREFIFKETWDFLSDRAKPVNKEAIDMAKIHKFLTDTFGNAGHTIYTEIILVAIEGGDDA